MREVRPTGARVGDDTMISADDVLEFDVVESARGRGRFDDINPEDAVLETRLEEARWRGSSEEAVVEARLEGVRTGARCDDTISEDDVLEVEVIESARAGRRFDDMIPEDAVLEAVLEGVWVGVGFDNDFISRTSLGSLAGAFARFVRFLYPAAWLGAVVLELSVLLQGSTSRALSSLLSWFLRLDGNENP